MFFRNREVIELASGIKHIVVDNILYNEEYYYRVKEVDTTTDTVKGEFKIISTVSENGRLFVKTIKGDLETTLNKLFDEKLNLE